MDPDLVPDPDPSIIIQLQSKNNKKNFDSYCYVKSSESESGSIDHTQGSADPDPHKKTKRKQKKDIRRYQKRKTFLNGRKPCLFANYSIADPDLGSGVFFTPGSGTRNRFFPDPGGPKTCGSGGYGSGSETLV
jgi:hypothetical protein